MSEYSDWKKSLTYHIHPMTKKAYCKDPEGCCWVYRTEFERFDRIFPEDEPERFLPINRFAPVVVPKEI
jgi:hypothetical protein